MWGSRRKTPRPAVATPSGLVPYIVVKGPFYTDATRTTSRYMEHAFAVETFCSEPTRPPHWADHEAHLQEAVRDGQQVAQMPLWAWWWGYAPAGPVEYVIEWRRPRW